EYPFEYRDRYGFAAGPRGGPVVGDGVVVTLGVTSELHALDLMTGKELWHRDLREAYHVPQDFFGHGASPLIWEGQVIVNVGGKAAVVPEGGSKSERMAALAAAGVTVASFDLKTGEPRWEVVHEWGASYAAPIPAQVHGREVVLVFAGGESDPPTGGLLCVDAKSGELLSAFPWRAADYISATASSPVVIPEKNRVLVTTCYPKGRPLGAAMVEYDAQWQPKVVWESKKLGVHWMTPVYHEGHLYGIDGERENNSRLVCVDAETGEEKWSEEVEWEDAELARRMGRSGSLRLGILRAGLVRVDDAFLCLGELGTLLWLDLSPAGCEVRARRQLFYAVNSWSLPAVSGGLLFTRQQAEDLDVSQDAGPRVLCHDLRGR
ncbi:MAG: PQQ-binding-like beta-propeller repeat protein, partial [Verrucomicrobiales bacterium]|nr:PQQ-binding-like beta-propeller repeat protein [Verrucomicrobiales bacterium]